MDDDGSLATTVGERAPLADGGLEAELATPGGRRRSNRRRSAAAEVADEVEPQARKRRRSTDVGPASTEG